MNVDENIFFREVTIRVCSSLKIELALQRSLEYISEHIPLDDLVMAIYDPYQKVYRHIAHADKSAGEMLD